MLFRMVLWWCSMTEVLLFSNDEKIFNLTNSVIDGRYKLTWCTYKSLEKKTYPYPDIVIMYFDKEMVKKGTFKTIVQVKGRLGQKIPILTLMEEGTPQNIFSTLMAGAYDYLEIVKNSKEYKKKIEDAIRWNWYLGKYGLREVVILNVTTIFALHEKRRKSSFRKSYMNTRFFYKKDILADFCSSVKETNERRFKS